MTARLLVSLLLLACMRLHAAAPCGAVADPGGRSTDGWGIGPANLRYQSATTITARNVADLELAWAFGLDDSESPHAYPLVTADTVYIGTEAGRLYALDRASGCERWRFEADGDIRTAIVPGEVTIEDRQRTLLFFGTFAASAYAVDAANGSLVWQREMDAHPFAMVTGSPVFDRGRLYVPVSAYEVIVAAAPIYGCCDFRGSVVALDAATGTEIWRRYTIDEAAHVTGHRWFVIDLEGPSGAPVWQAPAVDRKRERLYFATGENYSDPPTDTSDAVFAVDLADGRVRWHRQFTANDAWNAACGAGLLDANCPEADGPDFDFGAPPVLARTALGEDILLAGQKSGMVYALNPDDGALVWQQRIGRGGKLGGIHWGMAANESLGLLFVPVSDRGTGGDSEHPAQPGLHAIAMSDGTPRWTALAGDACAGREGCYPGISAAVLATPDLVLAGGLDGSLHAVDAASGESLWRFDTWRHYDAVNGIETEGGPIDVHGPLAAGDMLFVTSGYQSFGQKAGNAFLAFRLKSGASVR